MSIVVHEDFKMSCFHLLLSTTDSRNLSVNWKHQWTKGLTIDLLVRHELWCLVQSERLNSKWNAELHPWHMNIKVMVHHWPIKMKTEMNKWRILSCLPTKLQRFIGGLHTLVIQLSLCMDVDWSSCTKLSAGIDQADSCSDYVSLYVRELLIWLAMLQRCWSRDWFASESKILIFTHEDHSVV